MTSHNISAVIITLNEEATIARCLASVAKICDEIIVLDSHSTDDTVRICNDFDSVTCITTDWLGYSKTKNKGAQLAKHTFILSIDADEKLDEQAIEVVRNATSKGLEGAYSFNRKNFFGKKWIKYAGWYPDVKTRLYDKTTCEWSGDFVHETLRTKDDTVTQHLSGNIEHFTVSNKKQHIETVHKYARLAAERDLFNGKSNNSVKAALSACAHFIKIYLIKMGFLHGGVGLNIAFNSAMSKWLRYTYWQKLKA
mgnify:CR=1 FL=1